MKIFLCIVLLVSFSVGINAQSGKNVEENQFKINIINPGIEYEAGIGTNQTINLGLGLQFGASGGGGEFNYAFLPAINAQYRYFYNMGRRLDKGKRIDGNTGNYLAASATLFTSDVVIGNVESGSGTAGFMGPVYGIQRTYPKGFNYTMEFGLGLYFSSDENFQAVDTGFGPTISFSIGWVIGKNKNK
jgi:hypothetical protein